MTLEAGLFVDGVVGPLLTLVIDVGVLRAMEEPMMLFTTPILFTGLKRLTLGCSRTVIGFVIFFQSKHRAHPFTSSTKAARSSAPASLKALQADNLVDPTPGRYS